METRLKKCHIHLCKMAPLWHFKWENTIFSTGIMAICNFVFPRNLIILENLLVENINYVVSRCGFAVSFNSQLRIYFELIWFLKDWFSWWWFASLVLVTFRHRNIRTSCPFWMWKIFLYSLQVSSTQRKRWFLFWISLSYQKTEFLHRTKQTSMSIREA